MFDAERFVEEAVKGIKNEVCSKAIIACSGGVDSMVAAALAHRAVGNRLLAIYVDNGMMRKGETAEVVCLMEEMGISHRVVDAKDEFLSALKGIIDPEEKRKVIGERFIRIFEREAKEFGADFLVQGTIAPDWVESGVGTGKVVKSHHNVGGLPEDMHMVLVEPLRDLYKSEVRQIARLIGIRSSERQPFPGPALSVRCLGEVTEEGIAIVREACAIVEEEVKKASAAGMMARPWQYFAVLLPARSVGVRDGSRTYGRTVAIRAVASDDGMAARHARIPLEVLEMMSLRITSELGEHVNRVVYDLTDKPPATIEWE